MENEYILNKESAFCYGKSGERLNNRDQDELKGSSKNTRSAELRRTNSIR
jgi:hypothetical protein